MRKQQRGVTHHGIAHHPGAVHRRRAVRDASDPVIHGIPHHQVGASRRSRAEGVTSPADVRRAFENRSAIDNIVTVVRAQDLEITQAKATGGDRVRLPQGNPAVHRRRPRTSTTPPIRREPVELLEPLDTFADATSPRAGADAPQPRCRTTTSGWNSSATGCSVAPSPTCSTPASRSFPKASSPGCAQAWCGEESLAQVAQRARPGRPGARRHAAGPAVGPRRCAGSGVRRDLPRRRLRRGAARGGAGAWPAARAASTRRAWRRTPRPGCRSCCTRAASRCPSTAWWPPTARPMSAPSTSNVRVGDLTSTGHGTSRQRAEQEAAKAMLA